MKIEVDSRLAKVTTRPGKRDKEGNVTEGPTVLLAVEIPLEHLDQVQLGKLLQWTDQGLRLRLEDFQAGFGVKAVAGQPVFELERETVAGR